MQSLIVCVCAIVETQLCFSCAPFHVAARILQVPSTSEQPITPSCERAMSFGLPPAGRGPRPPPPFPLFWADPLQDESPPVPGVLQQAQAPPAPRQPRAERPTSLAGPVAAQPAPGLQLLPQTCCQVCPTETTQRSSEVPREVWRQRACQRIGPCLRAAPNPPRATPSMRATCICCLTRTSRTF